MTCYIILVALYCVIFASSGLIKPRKVINALKMSEIEATAAESVHLKLSSLDVNMASTTDNDVTSNKTKALLNIIEYVRIEGTATVLATLQECGWNSLEYLSLHKFNKNISLDDSIMKREVRSYYLLRSYTKEVISSY